MDIPRVEKAIVRNANWFDSRQDDEGFIRVPADEYYGIPGDASLIGHSVSVRVYAWKLTGDESFLESARGSLKWLADRQDERGGWHDYAGYSLDAAQCVMEGFCTYERLTGDKSFHENLVRAADRMIEGTVAPTGGLRIGNLTECGEYAHFAFLAWKQTNLERHRRGGEQILKIIQENFDEREGYWNTAIEPELHPLLKAVKPLLNPILRAGTYHFNLKGKTIAQISEHLLPLVMKGNGPQYALGLMDAEALLDEETGRLEFPVLRRQTGSALEWVRQNCHGPAAGSITESKTVPKGRGVYPLKAINDSINASLWPTAAYLLAIVGMNDPRRYATQAQETVGWILTMQDKDGGFWAHQSPDGRRYGEKYGNVNFYATTALWYYYTRFMQGGGK